MPVECVGIVQPVVQISYIQGGALQQVMPVHALPTAEEAQMVGTAVEVTVAEADGGSGGLMLVDDLSQFAELASVLIPTHFMEEGLVCLHELANH